MAKFHCSAIIWHLPLFEIIEDKNKHLQEINIIFFWHILYNFLLTLVELYVQHVTWALKAKYKSKDCFYIFLVSLILVVSFIVRVFLPNLRPLQYFQQKIEVFELFLPVFMQQYLKSLSYPVGSSGPDWYFMPTAVIASICVYYAYIFYVRLGILLGRQTRWVDCLLSFMLRVYPIMGFLIILYPYSWALVATLGGLYIIFIYGLILKLGIKYIAFQDLIKSKLYLTLLGTVLYLAAFFIILRSPPEFKFISSSLCVSAASPAMYLAIKPLHGHDIKILIGVLNRSKI